MSGGREVSGRGGETDDAAKGVELLLVFVAAAVAGGQKVDIPLSYALLTQRRTREAEPLGDV